MADWRYFARIFQLAITGPLGSTQGAVFGAIILVGVAVRLASIVAPPYLTVIRDISGWQVAAFVLLAIFVIRVRVAVDWLRQKSATE